MKSVPVRVRALQWPRLLVDLNDEYFVSVSTMSLPLIA